MVSSDWHWLEWANVWAQKFNFWTSPSLYPPLPLVKFRESKNSFILAPSSLTPFRHVVPQLTKLLVEDIFQDRLKYKAFLAYRGDEAQSALDCLQVVSLILPALLRLFELCCQSGSRFTFSLQSWQSNHTASSYTSFYKLSALSSLFQNSRHRDVRKWACWSRAVWRYLEGCLSWSSCLR